jgi:uncharacterized membrane protein HdeD (DUF308 family)
MWSPVMSSRSLRLRGILALIFGVIALLLPGPVLFSLTMLVGGYCLASGVVALVAGLKRNVEGRGWLLLEAAAGIFAGIATFTWPLLTVLTLTYLVAAWAVVTGVMQIAESIVLRRYIRGGLHLLSGIVSILLGLLIMSRPAAGALTITFMLGIYGIIFGITSLMAGREVRQLEKSFSRPIEGEQRRAA